MIQPCWKRIWLYLKKLNIKLLYEPEILLLGYISKRTGNMSTEKLALEVKKPVMKDHIFYDSVY